MKKVFEIIVLTEGELHIVEQTVVVVDGVECKSEPSRREILPGADVSGETAAVQRQALAAHTPECIALHRARVDARAADEEVRRLGGIAMQADEAKRADAMKALNDGAAAAAAKRAAVDVALAAHNEERARLPKSVGKK